VGAVVPNIKKNMCVCMCIYIYIYTYIHFCQNVINHILYVEVFEGLCIYYR